MPLEPRTPDGLARRLRALRRRRHNQHIKSHETGNTRKALGRSARAVVFKKTAGRCHICGGRVKGTKWDADHVYAHSAGGKHSIDNYLPAHRLCNTYRWDLSAEEFQWVLKIGVWTRKQMEQDSAFGDELRSKFHAHERQRQKRRRVAHPA
jgi:hypothetical protein